MSNLYEFFYKNFWNIFFGSLLAFSIAVILSALVIDSLLGYEPCILCLYERIPYILISLISFASFFYATKVKRILLQLCCLCAFSGAGIAIYHVGVEKTWWHPSSKCVPDTNFGEIDSLEEFKNKLQSSKLGDCSKPALKILSFSLAELNLMMSLLMLFVFIIIITKNAKTNL